MPMLTYDELAKQLGISPGSVRNLVRRKGWKRTTGNDKKTRIDVPDDALHVAASVPPRISPQMGPSVELLEAQIEGLKELVAAERGRADMAQRMASEAMADRDRWHQLATRPWYRRLVG